MATGKELKRLRLKAGFSAKAIADYIGVGVDAYRKWEERDANPRGPDKVKVERYFGTTLEDLTKLDSFEYYAPTARAEFEAMGERTAPDILAKDSQGNVWAIDLKNMPRPQKPGDIDYQAKYIQILENNLAEYQELKKVIHKNQQNIELLLQRLNDHDQTAKISSAYQKVLFLQVQKLSAKVLNAPLKQVAADMDRSLVQQVKEVLQGTGN